MDDDVDTLGRWMSHFLAERITATEEAVDTASKKSLQEQCCELILQLWERRASLPNRVRPLHSLSEVLGAIVDLRGNKSPYYGAMLRTSKTDGNPWLVFAKEMEVEALNLVRLSILQAVADSVLPTEVEKAKKFREFLSEDEVRIVEELQRLIEETSSTTLAASQRRETAVDSGSRSREALGAIGARVERLTQGFEQLRKAILAEQAYESGD